MNSFAGLHVPGIFKTSEKKFFFLLCSFWMLIALLEFAQDYISSSLNIFDPSTETFHPAANMASPRDRHAALLLPNGTVLIIGGQMQKRDGRYRSTEIYNPETDRFTAGPNMQWGRHKIADAVAVLPSGAVLVAGGWQQPEIWQPGNAEFIPVPGEMYGHHEFATATLLDSGEVLVLGGYRVHPEKRSASAWLVREAD